VATKRVRGVLFDGSASELEALIGQWNAIRGVRWNVQLTDFVGGSFDVEFTRKDSAIDSTEAEAWVQNALKHGRE
jgi:hypothetical protein